MLLLTGGGEGTGRDGGGGDVDASPGPCAGSGASPWAGPCRCADTGPSPGSDATEVGRVGVGDSVELFFLSEFAPGLLPLSGLTLLSGGLKTLSEGLSLLSGLIRKPLSGLV